MQKVTVRSATVCHDGLLFISACHHVPLAAQAPATRPLRKPHGDTRVGALERGYRVAAGPRRVPCRSRRLVESRSLSLTRPCRDVRCIAASFLKCRGWPSRQAPLAGALSLPGKILLSGPCLFILNALFLNGSKGTHGGLWRSSDKPCRAELQLPVHKFGILGYPYSSTPTLGQTRWASVSAR